jgi:hypothetical protein
MQQWEYHSILRHREVRLKQGVGMLQTYMSADAGEWTPSSDATMAEAQRLGREGWELVSISSRASLLNSPLASEEIWVFKRPVP